MICVPRPKARKQINTLTHCYIFKFRNYFIFVYCSFFASPKKRTKKR